jgi:DNA invertase Pin-like site-specific DNA recombinase
MLHSLAAQVSYYSQYIQSHHGWAYCGVYVDEALTGTKEQRQGFQNLLNECRNKKIDLVITKSLARFARNTLTLLQSVRELKDLGVDIYFEEENIHSMSGDGELMLTLIASYAQEESRSVSENMKWRFRKAFENGEVCNLRFLFGYKISKGKIEIDQAEAEVVREIFKRLIDGESLGSIATRLRRRKVETVFGGTWVTKTIRSIVSNEKYTGNSLMQKTYVNNHIEKKQVQNKGELPKYYIESSHPAIIDIETFDKAQLRLQEIAAKSRHVAKSKLPFTGKIVCKHCGRNFKRIVTKHAIGWRCSTFSYDGKEGCVFSKKIPEEFLINMTNNALGVERFDEQLFKNKIDHIEVYDENAVEFVFKDGSRVRKEWQQRSRKDCWTDEKKAAARQKTLECLERKKNG